MAKPSDAEIRKAAKEFVSKEYGGQDLTEAACLRVGFERGASWALSLDPWHYPPEMPTEDGEYLCAVEDAYAVMLFDKGRWFLPTLHGVVSLDPKSWQPIAPTREG